MFTIFDYTGTEVFTTDDRHTALLMATSYRGFIKNSRGEVIYSHTTLL